MRTSRRAAIVVLLAIIALAAGYATARTIYGPGPQPVDVIDLDAPTPSTMPTTTVQPDTGATVVPPPILPPPPPDDDDDDDDDDGDDDDGHDDDDDGADDGADDD